MSNYIGLTDSPAYEDEFGIGHYITGLSEFILKCDTPMTISIQGSWGSGKTSIMRMVESRIQDRVIPVFFNTWQFSQFDLGNALPISMLKFFLAKIGARDSKLFEWVKRAGNLIISLTNFALKGSYGIGFGDGSISGKKDGEDSEIDLAQLVDTLHEDLQKQIEQALLNANKGVKDEGAKKDRIVVFVDDLDRLVPSKAMELLEVLKLFLDCRKCVFVLAIDYDVVIRGAAEKYGFNLKDKTPEGLKEAEKGRAFFDKLIQVPFKVPVVEYDITKYMEDGFKKINITPTTEEMERYHRLCTNSVGTNPRVIKRILNAFLLLTTMRNAGAEKHDNSQKQLILFGLLCLQQYKEAIYNLIVRVNRKLREDDPKEAIVLFTKLLNEGEEDENAAEYINEKYRTEIQQSDIDALQAFMQDFMELIEIKPLVFLLDPACCKLNEEQQKLLDQNAEKYQRFNQILKLSAHTASETEKDRNGPLFASNQNYQTTEERNKRIQDLVRSLSEDKEFNEYLKIKSNWGAGVSFAFHTQTEKIWMYLTRKGRNVQLGYGCSGRDYQNFVNHEQQLRDHLGAKMSGHFQWQYDESKGRWSFYILHQNIDFSDDAICQELGRQILGEVVHMAQCCIEVFNKKDTTAQALLDHASWTFVDSQASWPY